MREILFRARTKDTGEWVEGDLLTYPDGSARISDWDGYAFKVDPTSVGQFTGLLDKNGKRIWEGDIIDIGNGYHGIVIWDGFAWGLQIQEVNHTLYSWSASVRLTEAIGNIHEPRGENDGD